MRRKDREVTSPERIEQIVKECHCCRLGFSDGGQVYIVPLHYGYEIVEGRYVLYFHGAKEGRKIDLIASSPQVGFEMDAGYALHPGKAAGECTASFRSIIGNGVVEMVSDLEEKLHGLALLMEHYTGRQEWSFPEAMVQETAVFKLTVESLSCKEHE